nr:MAG TPA: hypothetical protein [Inoviridae sp.]
MIKLRNLSFCANCILFFLQLGLISLSEEKIFV